MLVLKRFEAAISSEEMFAGVADMLHLDIDTLQVNSFWASANCFWDLSVSGKGYAELSLDCASDVQWRFVSNGDVGEFLQWHFLASLCATYGQHIRRSETLYMDQVTEISGE